MKKTVLLLSTILLTACSANIPSPTASPTSTSVPPTSTPTLTPTFTITPSPTLTPTSTPVPWTGFPDYVDSVTAQAVKDHGFVSWPELVRKLVLNNPKYNPDFEQSFIYPELPYASAVNQGYVLDVAKVPETRQRWMDQGVTAQYVLIMAFPSAPEAALVLCGLDQNGDYKAICPYFEGPNIWDGGADDKPLPTAKSLESLKGKLITVRFIDYAGSMEKQMLKKWTRLANPANANRAQTAGNYQNQIVRRGADLEIFKQIVLDKEGPLSKSLHIRLFDQDKIPPELYTVKTSAALQVWGFDYGQIDNPVIIPEVLGAAEANVAAR